MKGGIQGLKVSQVSLILIGFVCVTVLAFTWRKTMLLTTFIPDQSRVLQLDLDIPASVVERTGSEEVSQRKNKSKEADTSYVEIDQTGNITTTTGNKEISASVIERTGLGEHSDRKNKPQEAYVMPESVESDSAGNLTATTGKEDFPSSVVESPASIKLPRGNDKPEQEEIVPGYSLKNASSAKTEQIKRLSNITRTKDCNYAKGEWVFDDSRPLYSGFGCKQWLSSMWACRLTQRTDFEYEKLRWQPKGCQMEAFTGPKFLQRMQDKTLAFIGDSLGRQQFQSMMCMATGGEEMTDVLDVGPEFGLVKASSNVRPDGWAFRFPRTNTTILYYWSASLCDLVPIDPSNPSTNVAMHLDRPPAFLRLYIHKLHVIVLNTGHHWNRGKLNANKWVMYVGGQPNTNKKIAPIGGAKNFTIHSIVKWVDSQLPLYPGLKVFFRTISPRHFFNGEWNTGGTCDNTTPHAKEVVQDESSDPVVAGAVRGTDVRLLDITALSEVRDEGHISRYSIRATPGVQDCLHWCLPGIPDAWNEVLFAQI